MNNDEQPMDMADGLVGDPASGNELHPHRVLSRHWMKEREKGQKCGRAISIVSFQARDVFKLGCLYL
jgi:hypothetical protein